MFIHKSLPLGDSYCVFAKQHRPRWTFEICDRFQFLRLTTDRVSYSLVSGHSLVSLQCYGGASGFRSGYPVN